MLDLLGRIGEIPLPGLVTDWHETRWDAFTAGPDEARLFRGNSLIHGDIAPGNSLVALDGCGGWAVDWAWPTRGAAFIDPATLVLQLIAAGHTPAAAEDLGSACPGWAKADPRAIDAFARANLRMYRHRAERFTKQTWLHDMEATAQAWVDHRTAGSAHPSASDFSATRATSAHTVSVADADADLHADTVHLAMGHAVVAALDPRETHLNSSHRPRDVGGRHLDLFAPAAQLSTHPSLLGGRGPLFCVVVVCPA
ncbi:hypothetical protein [Streptomyces sp. NPDC047315]|uniref:hypothetical protein n=1 Tax=Streptomyces sp. NPDC047315 TaxID=3155142 RepID=UPI0033E78470